MDAVSGFRDVARFSESADRRGPVAAPAAGDAASQDEGACRPPLSGATLGDHVERPVLPAVSKECRRCQQGGRGAVTKGDGGISHRGAVVRASCGVATGSLAAACGIPGAVTARRAVGWSGSGAAFLIGYAVMLRETFFSGLYALERSLAPVLRDQGAPGRGPGAPVHSDDGATTIRDGVGDEQNAPAGASRAGGSILHALRAVQDRTPRIRTLLISLLEGAVREPSATERLWSPRGSFRMAGRRLRVRGRRGDEQALDGHSSPCWGGNATPPSAFTPHERRADAPSHVSLATTGP